MASSVGARFATATTNAIRKIGAALDGLGAQLEVAKYTERLVPSTRFVAVDGVAPIVSEIASFVAPTASVIGDVTIGQNSSVWYGATVRGDVHNISIGEGTSIGDRAVIHVAKIQGDNPTIIGDNVTIGAGAIVHAATIHNACVVGASAQVLDGSVLESNTIVAPGSIVTSGTVCECGFLYAGSPAKKVRELTVEETSSIIESSEDTAELAVLHAIECAKDAQQVQDDFERYEDLNDRDPDYFQPSKKGDFNDLGVLNQGVPGRIFDSTLTHPERFNELAEKEKG